MISRYQHNVRSQQLFPLLDDKMNRRSETSPEGDHLAPAIDQFISSTSSSMCSTNEDLVKLILIPVYGGLHTGQPPLPIDLLVCVLDKSMSVSLCFDRFLVCARVPLMGGADLMSADCDTVRKHLVLGTSDKVLGMHQGIAHEARIAGHCYKVGGRHRVPFVPCHVGVVDLTAIQQPNMLKR